MCVNMFYLLVCEYIHKVQDVRPRSSLTHETQLTLLRDQVAATSFLGFDKLYVKTIHSSASSTFGARCGSLQTTVYL